MRLSDDELKAYDRAQLKLPTQSRTDYLAQVDNLIAELRTGIAKTDEYDVRRFVLAGSLKKGTILQPTALNAVDADVGVYFVGDIADFVLANLQQTLIDMLLAIYPSKKRDDFKIQPRTLGIKFLVSGLEVDLVPVVQDKSDPDYGWQPVPNGSGEEPILTSLPGQLAFIERYRKRERFYRTLVRLIKRWRNRQELGSLGSFAVELICAHVLDQEGAIRNLTEGAQRWFLWVAQTGLRTPITFGATLSPSVSSDPAIVLDPVNPENNVLRRMAASERDVVTRSARNAWAKLHDADTETDRTQTLRLWRELMGPEFSV